MEHKIHHGKNVARFRQLLLIKQDALASMLGEDWNQMKISRLEAKEEIDDALLKQLADAMKLPLETLKNFDLENSVVNIQNNNEGAVLNQSAQYNNQPIFNPLEKYIEAVDKIEKLYADLLKAKEEQLELMKKLIEGK
jgi:transcriptional regulator with XRE-family HTH domain